MNAREGQARCGVDEAAGEAVAAIEATASRAPRTTTTVARRAGVVEPAAEVVMRES